MRGMCTYMYTIMRGAVWYHSLALSLSFLSLFSSLQPTMTPMSCHKHRLVYTEVGSQSNTGYCVVFMFTCLLALMSKTTTQNTGIDLTSVHYAARDQSECRIYMYHAMQHSTKIVKNAKIGYKHAVDIVHRLTTFNKLDQA